MTQTKPKTIDAETLLREFEEQFKAKKDAEDDREPNLMRLSAAGSCTRKAIFTKIDPIKEDISARSHSIFELGDVIHATERGHMLDMGWALTNIEEHVDLTVPAGWTLAYPGEDPKWVEAFTVPGHIDGELLLNVEGVILDVKSMKGTAFAKFLREGISDDYAAQLNSYLHAKGLRRGVLWAYCKDTSERHAVDWIYDPELQERVFAHYRTVHAYQPGDPLPPPSYEPYDQVKNRKATGISVLYFKCNYCPYRDRCWPDYVQDRTSPTPKFILDTSEAAMAAVIAGL